LRCRTPPPPLGAQPPPLWGSEDHVRELLGDRVDQVRTETRTLPVTYFATPEAFRDYFKINYGPTISAYRFIGTILIELLHLIKIWWI
jgi:hypothetical protein